MNEETARSGSLEKRNISVETPIDENVLTSSTAKAVRFRAAQVPGSSKTYGYVFNEVDKFVEDIVIPSLDWYQTALHERDKVVHYLGDELDKAETDNINLQRQIQYVQYNGQIKQGIDAGAEDREMAALMQRYQESELLVAQLKTELENVGVTPTVQGVEEYEQAITERDVYIEQITTQYNELHTQYQTDIAELQTKIENLSTDADDDETPDVSEELKQLVEARDNRIAELEIQLANIPEVVAAVMPEVDNTQVAALEQYIEGVTTQYNELYARYEQDTTELQARISELEATKNSIQETAPEINTEDAARIVELEAYIGQITTQYNELYARYEEDIVNIVPPLNDNELSSKISELEAYIEQISTQYNELYAQYQELEGIHTVSTNNAELGALRVELEAEKAKVSRLEAELAQYEADDEEIEEVKTRIPLLTEQRKQSFDNVPKGIDVAKLPEGIRADDLF